MFLEHPLNSKQVTKSEIVIAFTESIEFTRFPRLRASVRHGGAGRFL
jgi:hypothetical protein